MATKAEIEARGKRRDERKQFIQANADLRAIGCEHSINTPEAAAYLAGYSAALKFCREIA